MAYDEGLAERIRERLSTDPDITEKRMFGGIAFLHRGNVAVGVTGDLMVRVGPDTTEQALTHPGTRIFDMTRRPMRGWVVVAGSAVAAQP
ncbi:TfoX/Sxy family protein [Streptomyces mirabilis]|uniref:TfoX/Sxy family protein n=1 Tax=Streptomyces mirabilis TaxID=68239 RepID=UPI003660B25E